MQATQGKYATRQMNSEIRRVMSTASNSSLKQSCSALTSVTSALEVIFATLCALQIRALLTYLLTTDAVNASDVTANNARIERSDVLFLRCVLIGAYALRLSRPLRWTVTRLETNQTGRHVRLVASHVPRAQSVHRNTHGRTAQKCLQTSLERYCTISPVSP